MSSSECNVTSSSTADDIATTAAGSVGFAFLLVTIAGLSTTLGSLLACLMKAHHTHWLAIALSFSAGIMIYVSFVEIFAGKAVDALEQSGMEQGQAYAAATGLFFAGIIATGLLDVFVHKMMHCSRRKSQHSHQQQSQTHSHSHGHSHGNQGSTFRIKRKRKHRHQQGTQMTTRTTITDSHQHAHPHPHPHPHERPISQSEDENDSVVHRDDDVQSHSDAIPISSPSATVVPLVHINVIPTSLSPYASPQPHTDADADPDVEDEVELSTSVHFHHHPHHGITHRGHDLEKEEEHRHTHMKETMSTVSTSAAASAPAPAPAPAPAAGDGCICMQDLDAILAYQARQQQQPPHIPSNTHPHRHEDESESSQIAPTSAVVIDDSHELAQMSLMTGLALALHNFPEGLATFVGALADSRLGVALCVAISLHNIPEGICVSMPVFFATKSKTKAFGYSFLSGVSEPIGAALGYFALRSVFSDMVYGILFALVAGMMIYIAFRELLPTARRYDLQDRYVTISTFIGMAVMALSLVMFALKL